MPSHLSNVTRVDAQEADEDPEKAKDDIDEMVDAAQSAGFDAICAAIIFTNPGEDRTEFKDAWDKDWDERWTIPNPRVSEHDPGRLDGQLKALGSDLWTRICQTLASS